MDSQQPKSLFTVEDQINASPKTLSPYLTTAAGLSKWFADKVTESDTGEWVFVWDNQKFPAKKLLIKENGSIRYVFTYEESDPAYIEFRTETNEMTGTTFLIINDYSVIDDPEDLKEMYQYSLKSLKEIVGGKVN